MADPWPRPGDTTLDRARAVACMYRAALSAKAPERCSQLDARAIELGQGWIAPVDLPSAAVEYGRMLDIHLSAKDIEAIWHIPASTIRAWASKGELTQHVDDDGSPAY